MSNLTETEWADLQPEIRARQQEAQKAARAKVPAALKKTIRETAQAVQTAQQALAHCQAELSRLESNPPAQLAEVGEHALRQMECRGSIPILQQHLDRAQAAHAAAQQEAVNILVLEGQRLLRDADQGLEDFRDRSRREQGRLVALRRVVHDMHSPGYWANYAGE